MRKWKLKKICLKKEEREYSENDSEVDIPAVVESPKYAVELPEIVSDDQYLEYNTYLENLDQ